MSHPESSPASPQVAGLFHYPLKSGRGIASDHQRLLITGPEHDRGWMLVDASQQPAVFITQRQLPALATLEAQPRADGGLDLRRGDDSITIAPPAASAARLEVQVWDSQLPALDAGDNAAHWLRQHFPAYPQLRLVRFDPAQQRRCSVKYAGDSGAHTHFADGFPVLVCNQHSLDDLNARMASPLPMARFRPNLVLHGLPAWDEDFIDCLHIGDVTLQLVKPCARCIMTTTDQLSGERSGDEPLASLARFRQDERVGGVTFGWNAIVLRPGTLRLGDPVVADYRF